MTIKHGERDWPCTETTITLDPWFLELPLGSSQTTWKIPWFADWPSQVDPAMKNLWRKSSNPQLMRLMAGSWQGYPWFGRKSAEPFVRRPEIHPDSNNLGVKVRCLGFFETNQNQRNWGFTMEMLAQFSDKRLQEEYSFGWQCRSPCSIGESPWISYKN